MRLNAKWALVLRTICTALFWPMQEPQAASKYKQNESDGKNSNHPARAFLLSFGARIVDERAMRKIRAAQVSSVAKLTPFFVLANIVNLVVVSATFTTFLPISSLLLWITPIAALSLYTGVKWFQTRRRNIEFASKKAIGRVVFYATAFAVLWSIAPIVAFTSNDQTGIWIASSLTAGMLCCGCFVLSTVPQAAFRWISILYVASTVSLFLAQSQQSWMLFLLLTSYTLVVSCCVVATAWLFASHFLAEAELEQRGELIALLLNEFEEKESDWIWETDSQGIFKNVSDRFVHASGRDRAVLETMRMEDLAATLAESDAQSAIAPLHSAMGLQRPYRDIVVGVEVDGEEKWWSLAARPVYNELGTYTGHLGVASDVTDVRHANALVTHLAEHNSLTGIGNRSWFLKQAEAALDLSEDQRKHGLTLFLIDLDNFKIVNDTSGHPAGDELLRQVASRFSVLSEGKAILARFGGDKFAALGYFEKDADATSFAEEMVRIARKPFKIGRRDFAIGATIGFARHLDGPDTVDDLMRKADIALYQAKEEGRGRALAFEEKMEREVFERRELELDLRHAFESDELKVEFQPIVNAHSSKVVSSEVLLRWVHERRGNVSPEIFVPIAEHAGLMLSLGNWVLRKACSAAAACPELESISVNLSPVQFLDPNFVRNICEILEETQLAPERLILEVTEPVLLREIETTSNKIEQIRDLGIKIALDNFGTGYSSLSYLRQYKFDMIKIDKSFVNEIGERSDGLAIISAIIALAHNLGLEVIAEGVERQFQVDALKSLGCDAMQGHYFGWPKRSPEEIVNIEREDWEDVLVTSASQDTQA